VKALLADDDAERAGVMVHVLANDPGLTILRLSPRLFPAEAVAFLTPDLVLVDMARPDRDALDGIGRFRRGSHVPWCCSSTKTIRHSSSRR
jgi:response regulator NasT